MITFPIMHRSGSSRGRGVWAANWRAWALGTSGMLLHLIVRLAPLSEDQGGKKLLISAQGQIAPALEPLSWTNLAATMRKALNKQHRTATLNSYLLILPDFNSRAYTYRYGALYACVVEDIQGQGLPLGARGRSICKLRSLRQSNIALHWYTKKGPIPIFLAWHTTHPISQLPSG